jgi:hypothetical protein
MSEWKEIMPSAVHSMLETTENQENEDYCFSSIKELTISCCTLNFNDQSFSLSFRNVLSLKLESLSWLYSLSNIASCEQLEVLYLVDLWNLTNISILDDGGGRSRVFRNLKSLTIKQCQSLVDVPCLSHLPRVIIEDCPLFVNLNPLFAASSKEESPLTVRATSTSSAKLDSFFFKSSTFSFSSINHSLQHLSTLTLICKSFSKDCDLSCLSKGSFHYLHLGSYSFVQKSFLTVNYFNCRTLILEGFKIKKNVRFSTTLRKLQLRSCFGFVLRCDDDENDNKSLTLGNVSVRNEEERQRNQVTKWQKVKTFQLFDYKTILIPLTLHTFHLLNCSEIHDISMLGKVKQLCLDTLPSVTTIEGLGKGNESVFLSNLDQIKDFSFLNGIDKVSIRSNPYLVDGSCFTKVQHLKFECCKNLKDISMLKDVKSLIVKDCPRVKHNVI